MKHLEKCDKCGKEFDADVAKGSPEAPGNCDSCGADIKSHKGHKDPFLVDDVNADDGGEHGLEKRLREASHKADKHD